MYPNLTRNLKRRYDETISASSSHSSFATSSSATRRRKMQRRLASYTKDAQIIDKLRSDFKHIRVLGRTIEYSHLKHQLAIADADPIIEAFTLLRPPPIPNLKIENFTFVKACAPVEMAHLKNFDRPIHEPDDKYTDAIAMAAELTAEILDLPNYLLFPDKSELLNVKYWPKKFAGIEYASMGLKTRVEAEPIAQADAEKAYDRLMAGERVAPHDVRLGGRGKIAEVPGHIARENPPAVGRLILMMSHRDLKLCGITENQLTTAYCADNYPIAVGQSWYHGGSARFLASIKEYDIWGCFDARKFDSYIDEWMVRIAVNILRSQYLEGHSAKFDAYWEFVIESLVRAPIYRDDGIRLQKFCGTTSGHSHNTLIQSIITIMLGYATLMILHPDLTKEEIRQLATIWSLGDDNLMALRGVLAQHTVEEIAAVMLEAFNIDWYGKKSFMTTRLIDPSPGDFEGVQFLGKYWYLGDYPTADGVTKVPIPYRPARETYLRLLYPEYGTLEKSQTYLRILGNYIDAAGNRAMEAWLQELMDWMDVDEEDVPGDWPSNFKRMVTRDYSNVGVDVPAPMRLSYEQWRDLVVLDRITYRQQWPTHREQPL